MNLLETFKKLDTITEDSEHSIIAKEIAQKDALDAEEKDLNTKLAEWDRTAVEGARDAVKNAAKQILEAIPAYNDVKVVPVLRNALVDLGNDSVKDTIKRNKNTILNALKSENGLTVRISRNGKNIIFKNAKIDATDREALKYVPDYNAYCLDLYHLIECIDPDDYENESEDPGNLTTAELKTLAASINTLFTGNHWYVPISNEALEYANLELADSAAHDSTALVKVLEGIQRKLFNLQAELKFMVDSSWERLEKVLPLTTIAQEILDTKLPELQADFGTDLVYKALFDNIENASASDFAKSTLNFIKVLNKYVEDFKEYDDLTKLLSDNHDKLRNFKLSKPRNKADLMAKAEYKWREKRAKFEQDFKDLVAKTANLNKLENYWFAMGWLAKHVKKLRIHGPEELTTVYPYSDINYDVTTPKGYINASGIPNFAASGSIVLDTEIGVCLPALQLITSLVAEGNQNRADTGLVHDTKDVTAESKQINNLNAALYLAAAGFKCAKVREKIEQDPKLIEPSKSSTEEYKAFYDGYNA